MQKTGRKNKKGKQMATLSDMARLPPGTEFRRRSRCGLRRFAKGGGTFERYNPSSRTWVWTGGVMSVEDFLADDWEQYPPPPEYQYRGIHADGSVGRPWGSWDDVQRACRGLNTSIIWLLRLEKVGDEWTNPTRIEVVDD